MTGEKPKMFGLQLMKVEENILDLGDGRKINVTLLSLISLYSLKSTKILTIQRK